MLGQAILEYEGAQASLVFDGAVAAGSRNYGYIAGTRGSIRYEGSRLTKHVVTIHTLKGFGSPKLKGDWLGEGFMGTMGELLCSIESEREPVNSARGSLVGLAACFAAGAQCGNRSATEGWNRAEDAVTPPMSFHRLNRVDFSQMTHRTPHDRN